MPELGAVMRQPASRSKTKLIYPDETEGGRIAAVVRKETSKSSPPSSDASCSSAPWAGSMAALVEIPLLAASDKHLLDIHEDALLLAFNEADLPPVRFVHPKRLLRALR